MPYGASFESKQVYQIAGEYHEDVADGAVEKSIDVLVVADDITDALTYIKSIYADGKIFLVRHVDTGDKIHVVNS